MLDASLQKTETAVRKGLCRLEGGQDTAEYVLIIILFALAFTAGLMVWERSLRSSYEGAGDCIAATTYRGGGSAGLPVAGRGREADGNGQETDGKARSERRTSPRCPPQR